MLYFVFRISADRTVTLVDSFAKYREAKDLCRVLRQSQPAGDTDLIRMTFAQNDQEAKRLLADKRQISSPLEEWEA